MLNTISNNGIQFEYLNLIQKRLDKLWADHGLLPE